MKSITRAETKEIAPLANGERAQFFTAAHFDGLECLTATFRTHRYARHAHDSYVIGATCAGIGMLAMRGSQHAASSGSLTLFNPQDVHDGIPSHDGYSYRVTYPSVTLLTGIATEVSGRSVTGQPLFPDPVVDDPQGVALFTAAHHAMEEGSDALAADELLVRAYSYCLVRHAHTAPTPIGHEWGAVARVKDLLAFRYAENLTLMDLTAEAGLSRYHLIRTFQNTTGLTPHAYLINRRIEAAKGRLRQGETLVEVAAATGFSDQAHLTRVFKARIGVTPGAYRAAVTAH